MFQRLEITRPPEESDSKQTESLKLSSESSGPAFTTGAGRPCGWPSAQREPQPDPAPPAESRALALGAVPRGHCEEAAAEERWDVHSPGALARWVRVPGDMLDGGFVARRLASVDMERKQTSKGEWGGEAGRAAGTDELGLSHSARCFTSNLSSRRELCPGARAPQSGAREPLVDRLSQEAPPTHS